MCLFVRSGSHVAAAAGLRWDSSYPFVCSVVLKNLYLALASPSNQKRIETPLPLHVNAQNEGDGLRGKNGIGPK